MLRTERVRLAVAVAVPVAEEEEEEEGVLFCCCAASREGLLFSFTPLLLLLAFALEFAATFLAVPVLPPAAPVLVEAPGGFLGVVVDIVVAEPQLYCCIVMLKVWWKP